MTHKIDILPEEKSIWEYYNEMAEVEDNTRELDLADTILVFVCEDFHQIYGC